MNPVSLVRQPNQSVFDNPTPLPVQPFNSGFLNYSIDALGSFVKENTPAHRGDIVADIFAAMDERSLTDDTLLVARWLKEHTPDAYDNDDLDDENKVGESWVVRRVRFHQLSAVVIMIDDPEFAMDFAPAKTP